MSIRSRQLRFRRDVSRICDQAEIGSGRFTQFTLVGFRGLAQFIVDTEQLFFDYALFYGAAELYVSHRLAARYQQTNKPGTLDHFSREYPRASCTRRATSVRVGCERLCRL